MTPSTRTSIERALWNVLRPQGDPLETTVTVRPGSVDIDSADGLVEVAVYAHEDGVDVRVHDLQLFVKKQKVTLVQAHHPYPIERWTILWEGDMD